MSTEKLSSKGQAWFCTTGLPSDIVIEVEDMSFHLHKFPLMSKSRKLHQIITEEEGNPRNRRGTSADTEPVAREEEAGEEEDEEVVEEPCHISLPDFPGGSETFETAAKFCYGVKIDLTATNVAPLRCAGEYLEMTEEFSDDNLISKTERFLSQSVLRSIRDSVRTLKSCEALMPMAETLGIPERCIDSVAARASSSDPSLLGWPVSDASSDPPVSNPVLWNGIDTGARRKNPARSAAAAESWLEDLTLLSLPLYKRLISAMKAHDLSSEIIEGSLISYAKRSIPGLSSRSSRKHPPSSSLASEAEQRELLETVVSSLPSHRTSSSASSTRLLFGLLKTANILNASPGCKTVLEKKIASQLELATLDDLLLPSYSYLIETLYDVDCVERILDYFLQGLDDDERATAPETDDQAAEGEAPRSPSVNPVILVGKLIDGYLSEIASDANLKPEKFYNLAVALPDHGRLFDDGLYRAVDVYLKAHPWISEEEREKLCGALDCQKLTLEACTHAAQNERLPLRAVVQVLFFEQLQLRHAIAGSLLAADVAAAMPDSARPSRMEGESTPAHAEPAAEVGGWRSAVRENRVLRVDMDSMRSRVNELERECSTMRKAIEKIDKSSMAAAAAGGGGGGGWSSFTKKFGCKFRTQVCDSHERTVVETRRGGKQGQVLQTQLQNQESL